MNDDAICDAADLKQLEKWVGEVRSITNCATCKYVRPQAGYDVPYCYKRSSHRIQDGCEVITKPYYKLNKDNIPKCCKYWSSSSAYYKKLASKERLRRAKKSLKKLTKKEQKKLIRELKGEYL